MPTQLTDNQRRVLATLQQAKGALSAYALLDKLRQQGFSAPAQVYRALQRLAEYGLVHRLETLNAYVTCIHPNGCGQGITAFAICCDCGRVDEFVDADISRSLLRWAKHNAFSMDNTTIEIRGRCAACAGIAQAGLN